MPFTRATAAAVVDKTKRSTFTSPADFTRIQAAAAIAMDAVGNAGNTKAASAAAKAASGGASITAAAATMTASVGSLVRQSNLGYEGGNDGLLIGCNSDTSYSWGTHIGGTTSDEEILGVTCSLNTVTVIGRSKSAKVSVFDSTNLSPVVTITSTNPGVWNAFVTQYTTSGAHRWTVTITGNRNIISPTSPVRDLVKIASDSSANTFFIINIESSGATLTLKNGDGTTYTTYNPSRQSGYLCKVSTYGMFSWVAQLASSSTDRSFTDLVVNSSDEPVVVGTHTGSTSLTITQGDSTTYTYTNPVADTNFPFIARFANSTGTVSMAMAVFNTGWTPRRMTTDTQNNILLFGDIPQYWFGSNTFTVRDTAGTTKSIGNGNWNNLGNGCGFLIVKLTTTGTWGTDGFMTWGSNTYSQACVSMGAIATDSNNSIYFTVWGSYNGGEIVYSSDYPSTGKSMAYATGTNNGDSYIFKIPPNGILDNSPYNSGTNNSWIMQVAGATDSSLVDIKIDSNNNIYLAGNHGYLGGAGLYPMKGITVFSRVTAGQRIAEFSIFNATLGNTPNGGNDNYIFALKIPAGATSAQLSFFNSASSNDYATNIAYDSLGRMYIVGIQGAQILPKIVINP